jgi:galactan 5-O-arabinofuranosyltransferase
MIANLSKRRIRSPRLNNRQLRSAGPPTAELLLVLAGAALALWFVHIFLVATNFNPLSEVASGFGPLWAAVMLTIAIAAQLVQRLSAPAHQLRARGIVAVLAGLATGFATAPLTAGLRGTDQPLNTILGGDMAFRTEYVTRFASTWHLHDYTFKGLKAFYPPAWFWVAGRAAHVLSLHEPWHIMKPFTIATIGAALFLAYILWRMTLSPAGALSAAIGSSLVLDAQVGPLKFATTAWYSPYSCFVAVTGAAWVAATLVSLRNPGRTPVLRLAFLTLVGAWLALCYYLLFLILALVLLVLVLVSPVNRRRVAIRAAAVYGAIIALTAVFWIPLLQALQHGAASQGGFVRPDFLHVFVGIGRPVSLTVLVLVVVGALALTIASPASQAVAALLAGGVIYQLISVATLTFAHNQLQPHRAVTMMWATFGAAIPVALEAYNGDRGWGKLLAAPLPRVFGLLAAVVAVPAVFALGSAQGSDLSSGPFAREAHERPALAQTRVISSFITQTTGKRPDQLVVLSGDHGLLVTKPYYGFLPLRARYAHPEAHLHQRLEVLRATSRCPDPSCAVRTLENSRFGRIDALVLARNFGFLRIQTEEDKFPESVPISIDFRQDLFPPRYWVRKRVGGYKVVVLRSIAISRLRQPLPIRRSSRAAARACAHRGRGPTSRSPGSARCRARHRLRAGSSG